MIISSGLESNLVVCADGNLLRTVVIPITSVTASDLDDLMIELQFHFAANVTPLSILALRLIGTN